MEDQIENILVFATNIKTETDKQEISNLLDQHSEIQQWNIDQEDVDCVLRIVSETMTTAEIISAVEQMGFNCTELE